MSYQLSSLQANVKDKDLTPKRHSPLNTINSINAINPTNAINAINATNPKNFDLEPRTAVLLCKSDPEGFSMPPTPFYDTLYVYVIEQP